MVTLRVIQGGLSATPGAKKRIEPPASPSRQRSRNRYLINKAREVLLNGTKDECAFLTGAILQMYDDLMERQFGPWPRSREIPEEIASKITAILRSARKKTQAVRIEVHP
jgi:hypothetical protein